MSDDRTLSQQPDLSTPMEPGTVREHWGPFVLRERVGHGAFGEVYRAWDPNLEREVALKLLVPRAVTSDADYQQMLREARALASVRHANVVPVYGVDRHDDRVGFWTDFVHGSTLSSLVRTNGPLGYREAALIGIDIAHALSAVHRAGLLHRDIKAENVMRESGGRILLMDFGLSALPHHQSLAGTPAYMAPELFRGQAASAASDIYALGVLLFLLVTGEYPAPVKTVSAETADEIVRTRRSLLDLRPDLPNRFIRAIECCLCADAAARFQTAGMLANALSEALGVMADAVPGGADRRRKFRRRVAAAAAAVLLLAGAGAIYRYATHPGGMSADSSKDYFKAQDLLSRNYNAKGLPEAITLLNKILARDPSFALAEAGLGRAYYLESRGSSAEQAAALTEKARAACARALALDRSLAPPYVTLARLDTIAGRSALAMQDVHQALAADPSSAEAYGAESELYEVEGRDTEALAAAQKASDLAPEDWHWPMLLGVNHLKSGALELAEADFLRAAELTPDNPLAYTNLAQAQMQLNQLPQAEQSLRKTISIQPNVDAYSELGGVLTIEGKYSEAVAMNLKAVKLDPENYENWGNLATSYEWSSSAPTLTDAAYTRAARLAEKARAATPRDPYVLAALGGYYATLRQGERARPMLRQSLALAPTNPGIVYKAGEAYELLGERTRAIDLIAEALALGYGSAELGRNPRLAGLRSDPAFQQAVNKAKEQRAASTPPVNEATQAD
jgi:serine/threonine protein kinase/Tfp pilus assembly protein PilF